MVKVHAPRTGKSGEDHCPAAPLTSSRRHVYELFVLGELMDRPLHGYLLQRILSLVMGPFRQMSWGALYPLLRHLEQEELVEPDPATSDDGCDGGRPRKAYRITERGRRCFLVLMRQPSDFGPDTADLFRIKLAKFRHVEPGTRLGILRHHRAYLEAVRDHLAGALTYATTQSPIREGTRVWLQRLVDLRLHTTAAELAWVDREIATLRASLPCEPAGEPDGPGPV